MNLLGFMNLKLHFGMQNEKYINNKRSKDPSGLFGASFFLGQTFLLAQESRWEKKTRNVGVSQRNKYRPNSIAEIHSVAVAITNCILFPFYKSQFCFYVFVSCLGVCVCRSFVFSHFSVLVLFFPVRLLFDPNRIEGSVHSSQSTHDPRS